MKQKVGDRKTVKRGNEVAEQLHHWARMVNGQWKTKVPAIVSHFSRASLVIAS